MGLHSSKYKVAVLGASGNVGQSTLRYYSENPVKGVRVTGLVRDTHTDKARELKDLSHVDISRCDMSDESQTVSALKGFDSVFIVTPGDNQRTAITQSAIRAAKTAGIKHILVVSVLTVHRQDQIFGSHFAPIEEAVQNCGIEYTILRLPMFMDNNMSHLTSVRDQGEVLSLLGPDDRYVAIALRDVAEAAVRILSNPSKHSNKTYSLVSAPFTMNDMTRAFSDFMGKPVKYMQLDAMTAKQGLLAMGMPEWQVDGTIQLMRNITGGDPVMSLHNNDFQDITGHEPTSIQQWVAQAVQGLNQGQSMGTGTGTGMTSSSQGVGTQGGMGTQGVGAQGMGTGQMQPKTIIAADPNVNTTGSSTGMQG